MANNDSFIPSPKLLETNRIPTLPSTMIYIPNFLTPDEQIHILTSLASNKWTQLSNRRLQAHPCPLTKSGVLVPPPSSRSEIPSSYLLPTYLSNPIVARFHAMSLFSSSPHLQPNHCLVNEYAPGQGIMSHEDGGSYFPCTATISLGGSIVLNIATKSDHVNGGDDGEGKKWRVLQEQGSLLITAEDAYRDLLHGIEEREVDEDLNENTVVNWSLLGDGKKIEDCGGRNVRVMRTSLTYRDVVKVSNAGNRILGGGRK